MPATSDTERAHDLLYGLFDRLQEARPPADADFAAFRQWAIEIGVVMLGESFPPLPDVGDVERCESSRRLAVTAFRWWSQDRGLA